MEQPGIFPGRIRLGMVGGGEGAFIGAVHRHAARFDDRYELLAGALSSSPEASRRSGRALGLDPERVYDDYRQMALTEAARADGIEAVVIVTPNHMHAPVARVFLEAGIHVICDKPVTTNSADALMLQALAEERGLLFAVTHNYSAYPMVRHAQQMVREGTLGTIRVVQVEYAQDWLAAPLEQDGHKQAAWRTDPAKSGGGAIGDIGSHAWQLADTIVGQPLESVAAQLSSFVPGRAIDDDVQVLLRYAGGARGMLWASQVAPGHENQLRIRVFGSAGGIEWEQQHPNELRWTPLGEPSRIITRGSTSMNAAGARTSRVPAGHPEGYIDAFAGLYSEIACHLLARRDGGDPGPAQFPTIADGVRGVQFIETVQASSRSGGVWTAVPQG
ncbi:putative dehydrogenase [Duganella sp. SG902]|uniref:Gfo/Idh/MocA family protein n=1 Tax=Duganella sp. SG902 TaxID=2587016 RepID=UPI00159E8E89|nr:Gfo/Idh/MocA family oxidoreductase [Duganella sp. SG902]NVM79098.1 putative dehydrogenase [Duganella sp. SG902]